MRITKADYHGSAHGRQAFPPAGRPEIVVVGRSNAGKSSVINCLAARKNLAHTGQTPGVTTAIQFYAINDAFWLVDLPGYGFARVSQHERERWKDLIESYLEDRRALRLALMVVDARRLPDDLDRMMVDWLRSRQLGFVILANKADKLKAKEGKQALLTLGGHLDLVASESLLFSAHSGLNRDRLLSLISSRLGPGGERGG